MQATIIAMFDCRAKQLSNLSKFNQQLKNFKTNKTKTTILAQKGKNGVTELFNYENFASTISQKLFKALSFFSQKQSWSEKQHSEMNVHSNCMLYNKHNRHLHEHKIALFHRQTI